MLFVRLSLLLLLAVGGGLVYWTQSLARMYGYHPALGPALWHVQPWPGLVYPLYAPWQALVWQWQWGEATTTWLLVGGVSIGFTLVGWWWLRRDPHGSRRRWRGTGRQNGQIGRM